MLELLYDAWIFKRQECKQYYKIRVLLPWRVAEIIGIIQPGEEKALGKPYYGLSVPEGSLQAVSRGMFCKGT